jgi:hypothetical protein
MRSQSDKKNKARERALARLNVLPPPVELPLTASRGSAGFSYYVEKVTLT